MRVLLIVIGSLAGLALLAIVALIVILPRLAHALVATQSDPAAIARTAHKIATFDVPAGYHIVTATDLSVIQTVMIAPDDRSRSFSIQLQGSSVPSAAASQDQGAQIGAAVFGKLVHCDLKNTESDTLKVRKETVVLNVMSCPNGTGPISKMLFGTFTGNDPSVRIMAVGGRDFDLDAVNALLKSVR
jgi:hypothetical protein